MCSDLHRTTGIFNYCGIYIQEPAMLVILNIEHSVRTINEVQAMFIEEQCMHSIRRDIVKGFCGLEIVVFEPTQNNFEALVQGSQNTSRAMQLSQSPGIEQSLVISYL